MLVRKLMFACALAFAAACGGSSDSPEALMEKTVAIYEELGKAIEGAGEDCGKMASAVEGVVKKHEGTLKKVKEMGEKMENDKAKQEEMGKAMAKYQGRMEKAMGSFMKMLACADDPKMKELEGKLKDLM